MQIYAFKWSPTGLLNVLWLISSKFQYNSIGKRLQVGSATLNVVVVVLEKLTRNVMKFHKFHQTVIADMLDSKIQS